MPKLKTEIGSKLPPRVVLVGAHGVGKTTFGSESPDPVFVVTEDGASNIPVPKVKGSTGYVARNWETFLGMLDSVLNHDHDYKTLVVDTLNGAVSLLAHYVCQTQYGGRWAAEKGQRSFLAYGEGWKSVAEESKQIHNVLDSIRAKRGMNILLLTHRGIVNIRNPRLGDYHQFAGEMDLRCWNVQAEWADIVAMADFDMAVLDERNRGVGVPVGDTIRLLRCGGSVAEDTKCRVGYEIPEEMAFDATPFWPMIGKDEYTLAEVQERWDLLTKKQKTDTLKWLGVDSVEEAPVRQLRIINNRLREVAKEKALEAETSEEESDA